MKRLSTGLLPEPAPQVAPSAAGRAERMRCAKIVRYGISAGCIASACHYAFVTNLTAETVFGLIDAARADGCRSDGRSWAEAFDLAELDVGGALSEEGASATAQAIVQAGAKARGEQPGIVATIRNLIARGRRDPASATAARIVAAAAKARNDPAAPAAGVAP